MHAGRLVQNSSDASPDIQVGDIIVTATDGLWDNLFVKDIVALIESSLKKQQELQSSRLQLPSKLESLLQNNNVAELIAKEASRVATDETTHTPTPFETEARKAGHYHSGGKLDDITVIFSVVVAQATNDLLQHFNKVKGGCKEV